MSEDRRQVARSTKPIPCYAVESLPPLKGGPALYEELRSAVATGRATLIEKLEILPRDARSWKVPARCLWRIICTTDLQVGSSYARSALMTYKIVLVNS